MYGLAVVSTAIFGVANMVESTHSALAVPLVVFVALVAVLVTTTTITRAGQGFLKLLPNQLKIYVGLSGLTPIQIVSISSFLRLFVRHGRRENCFDSLLVGSR